MPIRRHCDPINVKRIWDAIRSANMAHQCSDINRIFKYMQNVESCTQPQVELYIKQCLKDGLIMPTRKSNPEATNVTYKITDQELPTFDGKDWYCFECHLAGEVNVCAKCPKVFHADCIKNAEKKFNTHKSSTSLRYNRTSTFNVDNSLEANELNLEASTSSDKTTYEFDEKLCNICNIVNIDNSQLDKAEMNYLLKFVLHGIRAWLPYTITHTMAAEDRPNWLTDSELTWRANQLFFEHRDMSVIEVKLNTEAYASLSEFLADVLTVHHNVAIFHGIESQEYQAAELMVRDTLHDITELKNCSDCYKHSNEKINSRWFALPCRSHHKLVWAKQKGYPYWPAKVIKETPSHYDVRFFGGKHERSLIPKSFIKPISCPKESLKIKPSLAFTKSLEELIFHQKLLADPVALEQMIAESKSKKIIKKVLTPVKPFGRASKRKTASPIFHPSASAGTSTGTSSNKLAKQERIQFESKSARSQMEKASSEVISGNVIDISDCEEEITDYSFRDNSSTHDPYTFDESYEQVSSSTETLKNVSKAPELHQLDQPYSDSVEKMRRKLETLPGKNEIIKCAMDCMQTEIDKIIEANNEHLKRLFESHNTQISETKKKQWCYNCEQDAIYHCCWNTAYCSQTCQQQHWQAEHKKVCRRKRQT